MPVSGQLLNAQLEASNTAGANPLYGELLFLSIEKSDAISGTLHGQVLELLIESVSSPVQTGIHGQVLALSVRIAETDMINPMTPMSVKSKTSFTIQASLLDGGEADSWSFEQQAGPTATMSGSGSSRTFLAPATITGATMQFSVTAVRDGINATPVAFFVTVYPHQWWIRSDNSWDPIVQGVR